MFSHIFFFSPFSYTAGLLARADIRHLDNITSQHILNTVGTTETEVFRDLNCHQRSIGVVNRLQAAVYRVRLKSVSSARERAISTDWALMAILPLLPDLPHLLNRCPTDITTTSARFEAARWIETD